VRPVTTLKKSWANIWRTGVTDRWRDNRHTLIVDLPKNGESEEVIRDIAGHVSKQTLKHYPHVTPQ